MKRVFGLFEAVFDIFYLAAAAVIGLLLLLGSHENLPRTLAGIMALVLAAGDAFHLLPRIKVIFTGNEEQSKRSLGRGKQIASITMTIFYLILWNIGLLVYTPYNMQGWSYVIYILAIIRILLCLLPQNNWEERYPPVRWGILRNAPFFMQGMLVAGLFCIYGNAAQGIGIIYIAIILSFAFYLPVVLWANKNPKIGILMLPKTCAYLWMIAMCLSL